MERPGFEQFRTQSQVKLVAWTKDTELLAKNPKAERTGTGA